jgi:MFS family permease
MKLNYKKTLLVGLAFMSISLFWSLYDGEIQLILSKYIKENWIIGFVMAWDNILALFMLPLFGALSDKTETKWGKRMPFIVLGTVLATFFLILTAAIDANAGLLKGATLPLLLVSLLFTLLAMSIYRSPAVALMPDVTVKPLRSKGNAIINLMGSLGGVIALLLVPALGGLTELKNDAGEVISVSGNDLLLFISVAVIMIILVACLVFTVNEPKLVKEKQKEEIEYGIAEVEEHKAGEVRKLSKPEIRSLLLILGSIFLWFMGYNAVTSTFSRYSYYVWHHKSYSLLLLTANVGAILAFLPSAMIASKLGRRKTILIGVALLSSTLIGAGFLKGPNIFAYILLFLAGVAWACINVNSYPMVVELSKNSDVGKYTGYYYTASMAAQIITPIFSGFLIDKLSWGFGILFPYGAFFSGLAIFTMFFVKHGDAKPEKMISKLEVYDVNDD